MSDFYSVGLKQQGASMVEYLVASLAIFAGIALIPVDRTGNTAIELLVNAIKLNYSGYAWGMSVPI